MDKLKSLCCCRFCGIQEHEFHEDDHDGFICLLTLDKNEQSDELNLLQKVHACLPVEVIIIYIIYYRFVFLLLQSLIYRLMKMIIYQPKFVHHVVIKQIVHMNLYKQY